MWHEYMHVCTHACMSRIQTANTRDANYLAQVAECQGRPERARAGRHLLGSTLSYDYDYYCYCYGYCYYFYCYYNY